MNRMLFLFSQSMVHRLIDSKKPPSHKPVTESSMPNHRDRPMPAPTATVQIGQIACAVRAPITPAKAAKIIHNKRFIFAVFA